DRSQPATNAPHASPPRRCWGSCGSSYGLIDARQEPSLASRSSTDMHSPSDGPLPGVRMGLLYDVVEDHVRPRQGVTCYFNVYWQDKGNIQSAPDPRKYDPVYSRRPHLDQLSQRGVDVMRD